MKAPTPLRCSPETLASAAGDERVVWTIKIKAFIVLAIESSDTAVEALRAQTQQSSIAVLTRAGNSG
jgi:hypothetical protein